MEKYPRRKPLILLGAMAEINPVQLLLPNDMKESKGMFTENFVCTQLVTQFNSSLFYYSKENSTLEIDFFVQKETQIVPIEVKAEINVKSKSLSTILQNNEEMFGVRFSMNPYRQQERMVNIPLYCAEVYFK